MISTLQEAKQDEPEDDYLSFDSPQEVYENCATLAPVAAPTSTPVRSPALACTHTSVPAPSPCLNSESSEDIYRNVNCKEETYENMDQWQQSNEVTEDEYMAPDP